MQSAVVAQRAPGIGRGTAAVHGWPGKAVVAAVCTALALVGGAGYLSGSHAHSVVAPGPAPGAAALARLQSLPMQAQSTISTALAKGQPAFAPVRAADGYGLDGGGLRADVGRSGVVVSSATGTLSMTLTGVGRGNRLERVAPATPTTGGGRVTSSHAGTEEWYAAGPLGIEQGFTITKRPAGVRGALTLALALGGRLHPRLRGSEAEFLNAAGKPVLRYGGLGVLDARGRPVPATLVLVGRSLRVHVADQHAAYPLRIDPLVEQQKLVVSDEHGPLNFGDSVAVSANGSTALIGGTGDKGNRGSVWVFTRTGSTWTEQQKLLAPADAKSTACGFGTSVSLSADGNTALIGGPYYAETNTLRPGGGRFEVGAAWVYTRSGSTWSEQQKIVPGDETPDEFPPPEGRFGSAVSLSADGATALIGAPLDGGEVGAAWVYTRSGSTWSEQQKIVPADEKGSAPYYEPTNVVYRSEFGKSVALSADGTTALIGGPHDDGEPFCCGGQGAAWVYVRSGSSWIEQQKIVPTDMIENPNRAPASVGESVALSADGDTALIGGPDDNSETDCCAGRGAAWVYTRSGSAWSEQQKLVLMNSYRLGNTVSLSADGNTALIGGAFEAWVFTRSGATWGQSQEVGNSMEAFALSADGNYILAGAPNSALVFERAGTGWNEQQKIVPTDPGGAANLGFSVAVSADGNTALVGGPFDGGAYGNEFDGVVWVFVRVDGHWSEQQQIEPHSPEDGGSSGYAGFSVALSADGNTALIGNPRRNDGQQTLFETTGAAWVYTRSGSSWSEQQQLLPTYGKRFGTSVALSADGNTALIGTNLTNEAWVFTRAGSAWTEQQRIVRPSPVLEQDLFGASVALSGEGNTALIGAPGDDGGAGAAWVSGRSGTTWSEPQKLVPTDETGGKSAFGSSVALDGAGDVAMIGAPNDNNKEGAAWAYSLSGTTWTEQQKIVPTDETPDVKEARDMSEFGFSVALSADGDKALIGGPFDYEAAGAAWRYGFSAGAWKERQKLIAEDEQGYFNDSAFGASVALSAGGQTALIGGPGDNEAEGAAWIFASGAEIPPESLEAGATGAASGGATGSTNNTGNTCSTSGGSGSSGNSSPAPRIAVRGASVATVDVLTCNRIIHRSERGAAHRSARRSATTQTCTGRMVQEGSVSAPGAPRAILRHAGKVVATGSAPEVHGHLEFIPTAAGQLAPGHYTLEVTVGRGKHARTRRIAIAIAR